MTNPCLVWYCISCCSHTKTICWRRICSVATWSPRMESGFIFITFLFIDAFESLLRFHRLLHSTDWSALNVEISQGQTFKGLNEWGFTASMNGWTYSPGRRCCVRYAVRFKSLMLSWHETINFKLLCANLFRALASLQHCDGSTCRSRSEQTGALTNAHFYGKCS